jgi:hypothetical protein
VGAGKPADEFEVCPDIFNTQSGFGVVWQSNYSSMIKQVAKASRFLRGRIYKGELISSVKMTSILGYIAVQYLTKASDIIRSHTFDAFFPLIMIAVLYFFISWLLLFLQIGRASCRERV